MKRQRFYERDQLTLDEKRSIIAKSDGKCCHCGKEKKLGRGATIDHFIPLHKGGSNRALNLIMMCEDCNKEKDDKIVDLTYIPYLKDQHKAELLGYLESYIQTFEYIDRDRMFALDQYDILLVNNTYHDAVRKRKNKKLQKMGPVGITYSVKLVQRTPEDFARICDYYAKYMKKYGKEYTEEEVKRTIGFWMQFGCIYYMERNGEIFLMTVMMIKHTVEESQIIDGIERELRMYVFSYYSSSKACSIVSNVIDHFPWYILEEQNLPFIPVRVGVMKEDQLRNILFYELSVRKPDNYLDKESGFYVMPAIVGNPDNVKGVGFNDVKNPENIKKVNAFFDQFKQSEQRFINFLQQTGTNEWVSYMLYDLLSCEDIDKNGLFDSDPYLKKINEDIMAHLEIDRNCQALCTTNVPDIDDLIEQVKDDLREEVR